MAVMPTLSVVYCPNPLRPSSEREHKTVALLEGDTVQAVVERLGLQDTPLTVTLGGCRLSAIGRRATRVRPGDVLVLQQVAGVAAPTGAAKLVMYGGMAYGTAIAIGTILAFAANVAISMALSAVASSLTRKGGPQQTDNVPTAYSIEGGANAARPYEPLPLVLGEHRVFPDYASRPFAEFVPDPTCITDIINGTTSTEERLHPPFELDATGNPVAPWTELTGFIGGDGNYNYYGDNAERTYTYPNGGNTVTIPHTFVVRRWSSPVWHPGDPEVTTYEDWRDSLSPGWEGGS